MAFIVNENGDIELTQGDSGTFVVSGLPTDQNYTVYFAFQNENRKPVGGEINVAANKNSTVSFVVSASLTNLLTVKSDEDNATYYHGVKVVGEDGSESTLVFGDKDISELNITTVYPKQVEGE